MLFDAHLNARALGPRDLDDLHFFGVAGALVPVSDWADPGGADGVRRAWAEISGPVVRRLRRNGIAGYAALGIHPARIPRRGVEALLAELPEFLGAPEVVAIGGIGLLQGTAREEEILQRQVALANELRMPVLIQTPWRAKVEITRRVLTLLRDAEIDPSRVLVDQADSRTVKMIRACGYWAGISLSATPARARPRRPDRSGAAAHPTSPASRHRQRDAGADRPPPAHSALDEAAQLVGSLGPEGLVLSSEAGEGPGDLLALARIAHRLRAAGLSDAVTRRVCGENAIAFLRIARPRRCPASP